ncbi:unnamed protein product, partial [marine sediment metagenome]
ENSSATAKLYLDGIERNSTPFIAGGDFSTSGYVGSDWRGSPSYTADGVIDELRVLNLSLDADSITKSYDYTATEGEFQNHLSLNHYNPQGNLTSSATDLGSESDNRQDLDLGWNEPIPYGEGFDGAETHGIVSYWSFEENAGNVTYDQAGDNDGTLEGFSFNEDSGWTVGRDGYALMFDGIDDYLLTPTMTFGPAYTFEAWVKRYETGARQEILGICDDPDSTCSDTDYKIAALFLESD